MAVPDLPAPSTARQISQGRPPGVFSLLPGTNAPLLGLASGIVAQHALVIHVSSLTDPSLACRDFLREFFYEYFHEENPRVFRVSDLSHERGRRARRYVSVARIHASPLFFFSRTSAAAFIRYAFEFPGRRFNFKARRSKCASIDGISTPGLRRHRHGVALRLKRIMGIPTHCIYSWATTYVPSLAHLARAK